MKPTPKRETEHMLAICKVFAFRDKFWNELVPDPPVQTQKLRAVEDEGLVQVCHAEQLQNQDCGPLSSMVMIESELEESSGCKIQPNVREAQMLVPTPRAPMHTFC